MNGEEIRLTPLELEDIKDTEKFRACVLLKLKILNGVPNRVTILETKVAVYCWLIGGIVLSILGVTWRVLAR